MNSERSAFHIEVTSAVILSLAVVISAWCGSESSLWSGIQFFHLADYNAKSRQAMQKTLTFQDSLTVDANIGMQIINAVIEDKPAVIDFYLKRLRPELAAIFTKWIESNPKGNPSAYPHPMAMPEYRELINRAKSEADKLRADAESSHDAAERANQNSDFYTLLTVLASVMLFIGGVESKFKSLKIRLVLVAIAGLIGLFVLYRLFSLPFTGF